MTVVGHSLGGGIAMQFAYQFPERTDRLVLVSSGGLGREVHFVLRAASLPGADYVLPALTSRRLLGLGRQVGGLLGRVGLRPGGDIEVLGRGFEALDNAGSRQAFLHTVRAVIEPGGQRVSAQNRLRLAALLPTLIVWGERDSIIPVRSRRSRARGDARQPLRQLRALRAHAARRRPLPLRPAPDRVLRRQTTPHGSPPTTGGRWSERSHVAARP